MSKDDLKSKKSTILNIRQRRIFSDEFKRQKVAEITAGQISIIDFSKLWGIGTHIVYRWIYKYSPDHKKGTTMVIQLDSEATKTQMLLQRISELERALGQKQMVIDFNEKLIEIASKELDIDLKKNFSPKH
ncbi:MAG: transposase [Emticicia sp.]|nr:transposase [Emticicia sp.]MDZ7935316.1 transposase [Emticicia sp.]